MLVILIMLVFDNAVSAIIFDDVNVQH